MKLTRVLFSSLCALGAIATLSAQPAPAAAPAAAPAPAASFTEAQLAETFGWFVGRRMGIAELEFTPAQIDAIVAGLRLAAQAKDVPYDIEAIGPALDSFIAGKQAAYTAKLRAQGLAEGQAFLAQIKQKPGVQVLPSGLAYEVVTPGTGAYPTATDTIRVHYTGTLINGTVFDSSVQRGEPITLSLSDGVIDGWKEGMQKINKGGKIKLYLPPELAYGDMGQGMIPPSSTLIFEVELLEINPPAPAAAPAPAQP